MSGWSTWDSSLAPFHPSPRWMMPCSNGLPAPLVSSPLPGPYGAWPSPDGRHVWFTSVTPRPYGSRNGASSAIQRVPTAGGPAETVVVEGTPAMKPMLSPDGATLVYGTTREGRTGLKARTLATGAERVYVTHGSTATLVRWLTERGLDARPLRTQYGDEGTADDAVAVEPGAEAT